MHITALVKSPDHVCCRYRLAAFQPFLEQAGHTLELRAWPQRWLSRLLLTQALGPADALLLQRKLPPAWQLPLLRRVAPLLLFDFDDAVFLRDSYALRGSHSAGRARSFAAVVRAADLVIAGNAFLGDHAALWSGADKVHIVPTCVDLSKYAVAEHVRRGNQVQLVWIGSASTLRGLERHRSVLEQLGRRLPGLSLKIVCDRFLDLQHLQVLRCPWSAATEAADLAAADIGLSWLPDDLWSRGKCGLKVLQYMAAGLPVVANPVGLQAELVRHGETGYLVETAEQLAWAVGQLAHDPELRRRMGRAGRQRAEAQFNVTAGAARWLTLLEKLNGCSMAPSLSPGAQPVGRTTPCPT